MVVVATPATWLRYGISSYVLFSAAESGYATKISASEAQLLISAVRVAIANTGSTTPAFIQLHESPDRRQSVRQLPPMSKQLYHGYAGAKGMSTWFETVVHPSIPKAYSHISGLLSLFKSKVKPPEEAMRVSITARFTYTARTWFNEWIPSGEQAEQLLDARARDGKRYCDHPLFLLHPGVKNDPVSAVSLSATWPHFREDTVLDNEHYSELNPSNAPKWTVRSDRRSPRQPGRLAEKLAGLFGNVDSDVGWDDGTGPGAGADYAEGDGKAMQAMLDANLAFGRKNKLGTTFQHQTLIWV